ncbi:hypothetical protein Y032_0214g2314 [Ancylostoma ceylanicum]|uniref:Uncharacterized protein n=1 Tax=Ancylostoma ceylanicum TaxID=53326 RepID=A0A016SJE0_9BILA|nr:hypothetical protein Y032_0214g2314 [Ancylostoma ceylanicum]
MSDSFRTLSPPPKDRSMYELTRRLPPLPPPSPSPQLEAWDQPPPLFPASPPHQLVAEEPTDMPSDSSEALDGVVDQHDYGVVVPEAGELGATSDLNDTQKLIYAGCFNIFFGVGTEMSSFLDDFLCLQADGYKRKVDAYWKA